ncbi:MAG: hypothetical protein ACPL68_05215, partial [Candidatus Hydrothermia bacterium]
MKSLISLIFLAAQPPSEKAYIMAQVVDTQGLICEINRGKEWGVAVGTDVGFYRVWGKTEMIAVGTVKEVGEGYAKVKARGGREKPGPGDLVQIKVSLPKRGWNADPILTLGRLYIWFTDDTGRTMFWPEDVLDASPAWQDTLLREMIESARIFAEYNQDVITLNGDTLAKLLSETDSARVMAYLEFVADFPVGYMGVKTPFPGAYATWLKQGSPPSGKRLARMLEDSKPGDRNALVEKYRAELPVALDWLVRWGQKPLALEVARSTGDESLIRLVEE